MCEPVAWCVTTGKAVKALFTHKTHARKEADYRNALLGQDVLIAPLFRLTPAELAWLEQMPKEEK